MWGDFCWVFIGEYVHVSSNERRSFQEELGDSIEDSNLINILLVGETFNWNGGHSGQAFSLLDLFLISRHWEELFLNATQHLT